MNTWNGSPQRELTTNTLSECSWQITRRAAHTAWQIIAAIKVSTSRTQSVAASKMLHHFLPDLIPPIDRQYTFSFFTGAENGTQ